MSLGFDGSSGDTSGSGAGNPNSSDYGMSGVSGSIGDTSNTTSHNTSSGVSSSPSDYGSIGGSNPSGGGSGSSSSGGSSSDGGHSQENNTSEGGGSSYDYDYPVSNYTRPSSTPSTPTPQKLDSYALSGIQVPADSKFTLGTTVSRPSLATATRHIAEQTPAFDLEALVRTAPSPRAATEAQAANLLGLRLAPGEIENAMRMAVGDIDRAATDYQRLTAPLSYGEAYGVAALQRGYGEKGIDKAQSKLLDLQIVDAAINAVVTHPELAEELRMNRDAEIAHTKRLATDAISTAERLAEVSHGKPALNHEVVLAQRDADFAKTALEARVSPQEEEVANVFHRALFGGGIPHDPRLDTMTDAQLTDLQAKQQMGAGALSTMTAYKASPALAAALGELVPAIGASSVLSQVARLLIGTEVSRVLTGPYQAVTDEALLALNQPIINPSRGILSYDNLVGDQVSGLASTAVAMGVGDGIRFAVPALATMAGLTVSPAVVTGLALTGAAVASSYTFAGADWAQGKLRNGIIDHENSADATDFYERMSPEQLQKYDDYWNAVDQAEKFTRKQEERKEALDAGGNPQVASPTPFEPFSRKDPAVLNDQIEKYLDQIDTPATKPGLVADRPVPRPTSTDPGTVVAERPEAIRPEPRPAITDTPTVVAELDNDSFDFTPPRTGGSEEPNTPFDPISLPRDDGRPGSIGSISFDFPRNDTQYVGPNDDGDGRILWPEKQFAQADLDIDMSHIDVPVLGLHADALM